MKQKLIACVVAGAFAAIGVCSTASAQEAVTNVNDVGTMITKAAWQAANIAKYAEQIDQLKAQLAQAQQQYNSLTGSRGMGSLYNNPSLSSAIPSQWSGLYSGATSGNLQGLGSQVSKLVGVQQAGKPTDLQNLTANQGNNSAVDYSVASAAYSASLQRQAQVQNLIGQINTTTDPKSIAELQARLAGEQAAIATEQSKLQTVAMQQQAQQRNTQAIADGAWQNEMNARGSIGDLPDDVLAPAQ